MSVVLHLGCYDHQRTPFYSTLSELSLYQENILRVFSFAVLSLFPSFSLFRTFQTTGILIDYHSASLHKDALTSVYVTIWKICILAMNLFVCMKLFHFLWLKNGGKTKNTYNDNSACVICFSLSRQFEWFYHALR